VPGLAIDTLFGASLSWGMHLEVRFFAALVDRTGCRSETIEPGAATDVGGLWELLVERHPALVGIGYRPLVACDRVWAEWGQRLDGVSEVAFLPPVSGG
jgi:molybdopterin converting factor small subunit